MLGGEPLTPRELEVLQFMADGKSSQDIAKALFLAPETIKAYRKRIYGKLRAKNAPNAVQIAMRKGLVK